MFDWEFLTFKSRAHSESSETLVVKPGELERAVSQIVRDRAGVGGIMLLIDSDDDCAKVLGPELLERAKKAIQLPVSVVLAVREIESWFLGSMDSLRGVNGIMESATASSNPENIRGAKEHLTENMMRARRYLSVDDQVSFAERFDLILARERCPSFDKCFRDIERLLHEMGSGSR